MCYIKENNCYIPVWVRILQTAQAVATFVITFTTVTYCKWQSYRLHNTTEYIEIYICITHGDRTKWLPFIRPNFRVRVFKRSECWFKIYWSVFQRCNGEQFSVGLGICLALNRWQTITWTNDDPVQWRMYASPGPGQNLTDVPTRQPTSS